jgi:hypothetical protein
MGDGGMSQTNYDPRADVPTKERLFLVRFNAKG